jgi:hypothetical protein
MAAASSRRRAGEKKDLFHVVHKVPAGDSPYVRAKHLQVRLISASLPSMQILPLPSPVGCGL